MINKILVLACAGFMMSLTVNTPLYSGETEQLLAGCPCKGKGKPRDRNNEDKINLTRNA